jgi:cytochrome c-type biogenesis protein CcmH
MTRRVPVPVLALSAALIAAAVALTVVALRPASQPRTLEGRVRAVAGTIRCPVCQDLSVADSPSGLARQMRDRIASDLQKGLSSDQIRSEFVRAYGDWILLSPPTRGLSLVVWMGPVLLLLAGLAVAGVAVRRWTVGARPASGHGSQRPAVASNGSGTLALSARDRRLLDRALAAAEDEPE